MVMRNKVFVAGCSFSDRFENCTTCWGEQLALMLDMDYNHDSVLAGGSNDRIWRVLSDKIMRNEITPDDKLFIQYTDNTRCEFISWQNPNPNPNIQNDIFETDDEDLYVINYKIHSHLWYDNPDIKNFLKMYEEQILTSEYATYMFNQRQYAFQMMLKYHNIDAYIMAVNVYNFWDEQQYSAIPDFANRIYKNKTIGQAPNEQYSKTDTFHLSDSGHKILAEDVYKWITK
jgi:hypothetical protein